MGSMFASVYKALADTESFISGTSFIHDQVQDLCIQFIQTVVKQLDPNNKETYEELNAQITCVTCFVGESLKAGAIHAQTLMDVVKGLNDQRPPDNAEYMQSILNLMEILAEHCGFGGLYLELGIDLAQIAAAETGRLRCSVLNASDKLAT